MTNVEGMARFGIFPENNLGISLTDLRTIAKEIGKNHDLTLELWDSEIRDARLLAVLVGEPDKLTEGQAEYMVRDLNSWDVCDGLCMWMLRYTSFAYEKAEEWSTREPEFEKRAAFSLVASLAVSDKKADDKKFEVFFPIIITASIDDRNYVKKAVNWALRSIGKRNALLNKKAIRTGKKLQKSSSKSARWIGNDAVKELESDAVQFKIARQMKRKPR